MNFQIGPVFSILLTLLLLGLVVLVWQQVL